jgi:hypothetical protein
MFVCLRGATVRSFERSLLIKSSILKFEIMKRKVKINKNQKQNPGKKIQSMVVSFLQCRIPWGTFLSDSEPLVL